MRIGIDGRMYGSATTTGIGVYIEQLTTALFHLDHTSEYRLLLQSKLISTYASSNPAVQTVACDLPWYSWSEQFLLPGILRRQQLDFVHFPHFNVPIAYRGKFVVTIHDITPVFFPGPRAQRSLFRRTAYQLTLRNALRRAARIITISEHTKRHIAEYFPTAASKAVVIPLGISPQMRPVTDQSALNQLREGHGIHKPSVLYIGVWRDHKNLPTLIAAFNRVREQGLDIQLILAGQEDPRYPEIRAAISASPYRTDILTPGFVPDTQLPALYSSAAVVVIPSYNEGFGLVGLEALACGTPVIASATTSMPEVLGNAAVYFDPHSDEELAKNLVTLLTDPTQREILVGNAKHIVEKYSWEQCAARTLEVYRQI